ncbi:MAG: hypothetical protein KJ556_12205 [Gammaproteobacteria bacterium]|nr:hypothetical protein [Gammaproteobacteria bacterium]MBU2059486.1 hypothetical protein [Gammaproteobacteria bacterium]MBU2175883.1 hypothetical protein [Gammaproteobacteria bacterium]MBU2246297.1 hypothetical protein [Gammaproteobacteria bacterium]MBU2345414.1 hypothetical protein [Gammaproteobacteria bacterium]
MPNINSSEEHSAAMPKLAVWLLSRLANPAYRDELIGDMEEEYRERKQTNQDPTTWLLRQTLLAIWDGQNAMVKTTGFVKALGILLCVLALPTIALFVGWLSTMQKPSEHLWQLLLAGEVHSLLLNGDYWRTAWQEGGISQLEFGMFIDIPSMLWAIVFVGSTYLFFKKSNPSVWVYSAFALAYMLVPYLAGYTVISSLEPAAHKVGPILAFMMLAPFFTLPLYLGFLFKRFAK